jgi:DNA-binding NtrC family response regulator
VRILVVDDDQSAADGLAALLKLDGHDVALRTSGAEATTAIADEPFDAVITDLEMPEIDGHAVVRAAHKHLPLACVLVCGAQASRHRRTLTADGACFIVDKPMDYDRLSSDLVACRRECARVNGCGVH